MDRPMSASSIFVSHNAEIAHRLSQLEGKCQRIHGHSMHITMTLTGNLDEFGILGSLDFGTVKKAFRGYIDNNLDHHLHLNENDPWAQKLYPMNTQLKSKQPELLPGLVTWPADPTTENIAIWVAEWMWREFSAYATSITISIQETGTNGASYSLP